MGGSVGRVVSVVAAVAIPVYAPQIAASFGVSSAINTAVGAAAGSAIGTVAGSAVTGAALGAVSAIVTGQPISRGAITGFIGGGIGGGIDAFTGGAAAGDVTSTSGQVSGGLPSVPEVGLSTASPADAVFGTVPTSATPTVGTGLTTADFGVSQALTRNAPTTGLDIVENLKDTGSKVLDKVTNADALASLTVQAVGQLTAAALVPDSGLPGFSPEEQELVATRRQELEELKARDIDKYNQQIELSKRYLTQAGYVDPNYFANQARNQAAILGARQRRELEDERAFNPTLGDFTTADINRMNVDQARRQASAFDTGFLQGVNLQNQLTDRATASLPTSNPNYAAGLAGLQTTLGTARELGDTDRTNLAKTLAGLNTTSGRTEKDQETIDNEIAMVGRQSQVMLDEEDKNLSPIIGSNQYNAGLIRST